MGVFMALLCQPRAEGVTRMPPADLGRVLGLDRAPEVKTLRRKLAELAGHSMGAQLQAALGAHHAKAHPDAVGFRNPTLPDLRRSLGGPSLVHRKARRANDHKRR